MWRRPGAGPYPLEAVEGAVNATESRIGSKTEVEFIEMLTVRTSCFDEDARESEITIEALPELAEAAA